MIKHFLKYPGGKFRALEHILPHLPKGKRLVEPFAGTAVVSLNSPQYEQYWWSDANGDLMQLYVYARMQDSFIEKAKAFFTPRGNNPQVYYYLRSVFNSLPNNNAMKSYILLYMNRHGYNGLIRYNGKGGYNVPFGDYKKPYFPEDELTHWREWMHNNIVTITSRDFRRTFAFVKGGDVIYCDPPYVNNFDKYTRKGFSMKDQISLAELARSAPVPVLISNSAEALPFYKDADKIIKFSVGRSISRDRNGRNNANEILAIYGA